MDDYEFALELARRAHAGQVDKAGKDYIRHPMAVAAKLTDPQERVVALLHDVLEDTVVPEAVLRKLFGDTIADAVAALTRNEGESYENFILRAKRNAIARRVKLADLAHNSDSSRLPTVTPADLARLEKYRRAALVLEAED